MSTPGTQKKTKFDLKASLSKPLGYKPHTGTQPPPCLCTSPKAWLRFNKVRFTLPGKLKPFGEPKENMSANKSLVAADSHQKMYKQQRVQTRYVSSLSITDRCTALAESVTLSSFLNREERRNQQVVGRRQKKQDLLGARRGLVML